MLSTDALNGLVFATTLAPAGVLLALGARRLLGRRLPLPRSLLAGVGACAVAVPVAGTTLHENSSVTSAIRPALWASAVAMLAGMALLVIAELFVPSGSLPSPLSVVQGLRGSFARTHDAVE